MLVTFQSKINKVKLTNNIAYFETATIQEYTRVIAEEESKAKGEEDVAG